MKSKILLPIIGMLVVGAIVYSGLEWRHQSQFSQWARLHAKRYSRDQYTYRYGIYKQTVKEVTEHNQQYEKGESSYYKAVNQFADLTDQQFSHMYLSKGTIPSAYQCTGAQPPSKDLPESFDWAAKSAVTSIRSQGGSCQSGYAIVAAESIQSGRYITISSLKQLSPQQIIDCSKSQGNQGCKGGNVLNSFEYIKRGGIALQSAYPYVGSDQQCTYNLSKKDWEILGCVAVTPKSQAAIKAAVFHQPLAVSINASKLKTYSGGVYESGRVSSCKTDPNGWMLMVGYGKDGKKDFWKLKNSWGSSWGTQGYLYIVRKGDGQGECGVQNQLYFPID